MKGAFVGLCGSSRPLTMAILPASISCRYLKYLGNETSSNPKLNQSLRLAPGFRQG